MIISFERNKWSKIPIFWNHRDTINNMEESTYVYQYLFLTECNQNILSRSDSSFQHDHGKISKISLLHSNMTMERWINNDKDYSLLVSLCYVTYLELYQKTCLINSSCIREVMKATCLANHYHVKKFDKRPNTEISFRPSVLLRTYLIISTISFFHFFYSHDRA